jgi:stage IV sporulation protein FB
MLRFTLLGFPVIIHWFFWLTLALLGGVLKATDNPEAMQRALVWVVAGAVSIIIHELGHALTMRKFGGRQVHIVLHSFGGYATCDRAFNRFQSFLVSGAGPFYQIVAGLLMWVAVGFIEQPSTLVGYFMRSFVNVSLIWAILNLFPIFPLDGGHILKAILGPSRLKLALIISLICAVVFGALALFYGQPVGILFGFFAFNNLKQLRGEPVSMFP